MQAVVAGGDVSADAPGQGSEADGESVSVVYRHRRKARAMSELTDRALAIAQSRHAEGTYRSDTARTLVELADRIDELEAALREIKLLASGPEQFTIAKSLFVDIARRALGDNE